MPKDLGYEVKDIIQFLPIKLSKRGDYWTGNCPFHDDKHPSFSIHKNGFYKCFSGKCSHPGDSVRNLVRELTGQSVEQLLGLDYHSAFVRSVIHQPISLNPKIVEAIDTKEKQAKTDYKLKGIKYTPFKDHNEKLETYMKKRGITPEFIEYYEIFYVRQMYINDSLFENRLIIPVYNKEGIIIGYEGRDFTGKSDLKVKYSKDFCTDTIFGLNKYFNPAKPIIFVEGIMDLPNLFRMGLRNIFSTFSCNIEQNQLKFIGDLLKNGSDLTFFLDNDEAGRKEAIKLDDSFSDITNEFYVSISDIEKEDPGKILNLNRLKKFLDERISITQFMLEHYGIIEKEEKKSEGWYL